MNLRTVQWSDAGFDWKRIGAPAIARNVLRKVRAGSIILLHDGDDKVMGADRGQTVIATESLIRRYKDKGYEFGTVPEMMKTVSSHLSTVS